MVVTPSAMQELERRAFAQGASAEELMDEAGAGTACAVRQFHPEPGTCLVVFGKGHNGGDALVAARHLAIAGWETFLLPAAPEEQWSELTRKKFGEAGLCRLFEPAEEDWAAVLKRTRCSGTGPIVVLDGLLGVGATGLLRGILTDLTQRMNALRETAHAHVVAIDLPTGLDGDTGAPVPDCVVADLTVTIGFAKRGLLADGASNFVGRLVVLPLAALTAQAAGAQPDETVAYPEMLAPLLARRAFESHKGIYGRIAIVAGSRGFTGAALLCSAGCVRAGAGLISLYVPEDIYPIVAASALPEVMVHPVRSYAEVLETKFDVLAIGPGLGHGKNEEVLDVLRRCDKPAILDADALHILPESMDVLDAKRGPRLLTPHPGEMERLDPFAKNQTRRKTAERFVARHGVTLLLKGARTVVAEHGRPLSFNSTGHPGMATGGMGDVLTGVCAALTGQGLALYDAARVGAWLCGRAAELALSAGRESQESLTPTALLAHLGVAFRDLHERCY
ncbi:MAG TPA: NAD(P)H-hydrate dehydratase [Chthoniobacteraceae bacterium]|jgi:NAD(P)H-hydrate epimerase|nr:NAD(P)H-hydrate dehydratase [Chthoniobacteraceae bacterium]